MAKEPEKKKGASVLYDNDRSQTEADRMAEGEGEAAAEAVKGDEGAAAPEGGAEDAKLEAGEDKGLEQALKGVDELLTGLQALHKSHEAERRDMHGNYRDSLRQMHGRHEKQLRELMDKHASMGKKEAPAQKEEA